MEILSFSEARMLGLVRYFTGKPCKNGHVAERLVSNRSCLQCVEEKARWLFENKKDVVRARKAKAQKNYRKNHPEKAKAARQAWAEKNRSKDQDYKKKWRTENKGTVNFLTRKRQLSKIQRTPHWLTEEDHWMIEQAYELAALRTKLTGISWHVDHKLPLQGKTVSGLHVPLNLQVIPGKENLMKHNRYEVAL